MTSLAGRDSGVGMTSRRTRLRMVGRLREQGIRDEAVLAALAAVPRHLFVDEALASRAYEDTALPIDFKQTISQPYIVARMIEILRAGRDGLGRTLEVGTGSGYQAAVLAQLTRDVYSVERIEGLLARAESNLRRFRAYMKQADGQFDFSDEVALVRLIERLKHADDGWGLPKAAPFDTIVVAAGAAKIPEALLQQLALGGRMLMPVGSEEQRLTLVERRGKTCVETRLDEEVRFVPLVPPKPKQPTTGLE